MKHFLLQFAQKISAGDSGIPVTDGNALLQNGLNLFYFLVGATAVIVIISAGIMYVISNGDAGKVAKAKNLLFYAVIGLVLVFAAFSITSFVIGRFK